MPDSGSGPKAELCPGCKLKSPAYRAALVAEALGLRPSMPRESYRPELPGCQFCPRNYSGKLPT